MLIKEGVRRDVAADSAQGDAQVGSVAWAEQTFITPAPFRGCSLKYKNVDAALYQTVTTF